MTLKQKTLCFELLTGEYYLRLSGYIDHKKVYKLYEKNQVPVKYYSWDDVYDFKDLLKKDAKGRLTISLKKVRALDGRSYIKKAYKRLNTKIVL